MLDRLSCFASKNAMVNPCTGKIHHGSSATITCVTGFTLIGKSTVTCFEGGYDSTPSCKAHCQALSVPHAEVKPTSQVAHGTTVQVDCNGGNTLIGNPNPTCNDGSFNELPTCGLDVTAVVVVKQKNFTLDLDIAWKTPGGYLDRSFYRMGGFFLRTLRMIKSYS